MTNEAQQYCKEEIQKYIEADEKEKEAIRNNLFLFMQDDMERWVRSILRSLRTPFDKPLLIELSWDCFYYGLHSYKKLEVPLAFHFFKNSRYCILKRFRQSKEQSSVYFVDTIDENLDGFSDGLKVLELTKFIEYLPDKYKPIFQDALFSTYVNTRLKTNENWDRSEMPYLEYRSAKAVLSCIIRYFLSEN